MHHFLNKFKRVTSQGSYLPEVDGLRFLAIFMVVMFHINGFYYIVTKPVFQNHYESYLNTMILTWDKGVQLFFIISGFILALPFANYALKGGRKISLKSFYLRRITRLEPPYFLAMIIMFTLLLYKGKYTLATLWPSLLASLTYTHNIVFGPPLIAVVTWSLEVEIQFYLLAPFISKVFLMGKNIRRGLLITAVGILPIIQFYIKIDTVTIYNFLQYFLLGLLLADFFVSNKNLSVIKNKGASILIGIAMFAVILLIDTQANILNNIIFSVCAFLFYMLVLFTKFWKKVFSVPFITIIGGMCYSMYLWHFTIISFFGYYILNYTINYSYNIALCIFSILLGLPIIGFTALYFYFIEKPCMAKDWHKAVFS